MKPRDARFFGVHACRAVWAKRPGDVHRAFVSEETSKQFGDVLKQLAEWRKPYRMVSDEELEKVSGTRHHEGVCFVAEPVRELNTGRLLDQLEADEGPATVLFLDGVDNPHNVGAILRSAAYFGCAAVAGLADDMPAPAGAVARTAQGGTEQVPMLSWNRPHKGLDALRDIGFVRIATVVEGGEDLYRADLPERCVFLLGAEHSGLGESARAIADRAVTIPGAGAIESLNVAVASALLLAEHYRRFRQ